MPKQVTIKDYDGDEVRVDCQMQQRFYIDTKLSPEGELGEACVSLDRPSARAIIKTLEEWLGDDDTFGITPNIIIFS